MLLAIAPALLETVLGRLALLFLTGAVGDPAAAREAAIQMLSAYNVKTPDELCLAAEVIGFGFHALEALSQAAAPDLALTRILRLRGSAVSLSREGHKAQRKLDQLQRNRRAGVAAQPVEIKVATPAQALKTIAAAPRINQGIDLPPETVEAAARNGGKTWTQAFQKRLVTQRIAENLKKNRVEHANQLAAQNAATTGDNTAGDDKASPAADRNAVRSAATIA